MGEKETMTGDEAARTSAHATERKASGGHSGDPLEAANLNPSKSNVERLASSGSEGGDPGGDPLEATNLNSSRSNIYRAATPGSEGPEPPEGEPPGAAETTIIKSKSNITNN